MASFLTALASVGSNFGEGVTAARQDRLQQQAAELQRRAQEQGLAIQQQQLKLGQATLPYELARARYMPVGKRLWDIQTNRWVDLPTAGTGIDHYIGMQPKENQAELQAVRKAAEEADADPTQVLQDVIAARNKQEAETFRVQTATTAEQNKRQDAAERERQHREDMATQAQERREARQQAYEMRRQMFDFMMAERQKFMSPQERQVYDSIKLAEPMTNRLVDVLQQNHLLNEGGAMAMVKAHLRFKQYQAGMKPAGPYNDLIKDAAALQVMGARPWMSMGRGKYTFEVISQHLPSPTDTPELMYDKVTWLRDNVLSDAMTELQQYVLPGGSGTMPGGSGVSGGAAGQTGAGPATISPAAQAYIDSQMNPRK